MTLWNSGPWLWEPAGLAHSPETSAVFNSINTICQAVMRSSLPTICTVAHLRMFNDIISQFGLKASFVGPNQPENFTAVITPRTKAPFCETLSNPACDVADIEAFVEIAHANTLLLIVDATFTTLVLQRSIDFGADVIVNFQKNWLGGHGIGEVVVDSGKLDWKSEYFPLMIEPDSSYDGLRWAHDLPPELAPLAYILHMRTVPLRYLRACISPDNAWMFLQGLETVATAHGTAL